MPGRRKGANHVDRITRRRALALFVGLTLLVLIGDLWSKQWAFASVAGRPVTDVHEAAIDESFWNRYPHPRIDVIPAVLSLKLTTNTGAVFGLGKGRQWFFVTISVVATAVICAMFWRSRPRAWVLHTSLALVLAGALGNLYDRIRFGVVRDFLWLLPDTGLWPWIFNVADVALVTGVSLLVLIIWFSPPQTSSQGDSPDSRRTPQSNGE
jgi:signal peptidase II